MSSSLQVSHCKVTDGAKTPSKEGVFCCSYNPFGLDRPTLSVSAISFNQSLDILYISYIMIVSGSVVFELYSTGIYHDQS